MNGNDSPRPMRVWPYGSPAVLPVIHAETVDQIARNVARVVRSGGDGVFLISHESDDVLINRGVDRVKSEFPELWVGANYLVADEYLAAVIHDRVDAVWVDDARIDESDGGDRVASRLASQIRLAASNAVYFGGAAFKYGPAVHDVEMVARKAARFVDVVTTSGPETGTAPTVRKVRQVAAGAGSVPIAIASGLTPANVTGFSGAVDYLLVATGVSDSFTELNEAALSRFVAAARTMTPRSVRDELDS